MAYYQFYNPVRVFFGQNSLEELATMELPGKKAMIFTTPPTRHIADRVVELLKKNQVDSYLYDGIKTNPNNKIVEESVRIIQKEGCDFVLSIGGGSSTDTAKAAALMMNNKGDLWDYMGWPAQNLPEKGAAPIVAVSTTSGTGTEVNQFAVITREETNEKIELFHETLFPTISIVDPCLQVSVPPALTAYQGMDAIYHAAEGIIVKASNPPGDMYALESLRLAAKNLVSAYKNGNDIEAREGMCLASMYAGYTESVSSCASIHGLAEAIAAIHVEIPHGAVLSLFAVEFFKYYEKYIPERMVILSEAVGFGSKPEGFVDFLEKIFKDMGIDRIDYRQYGVDPARAQEYANLAYSTRKCLFDADIYTMPMEDCVDIIQRSLK